MSESQTDQTDQTEAAAGYTFQDLINTPPTGQIIVLSLVVVPLCIIATVLRLVGTRRAGRKLSWDDLLTVLALLSFLVYALSPLVGVGLAADMTDLEIAVMSGKIAYIATPFFYLNQLFARGSLIVLYYRIFWSDRAFVRWITALATVHVSWFIAFFFGVLFLCTPISKWWDVLGEEEGFCLDGNTFLVAEETINSTLDFAMIGLAVYVVQKVMTKHRVKMKLAFIFGVGGLSGVIGFVKIGIVYYTANDTEGQANSTNAFWDILQMATSIFCTCAPLYKTMVPLGGVWMRIKSSTKSWASSTKLYSSRSRSKRSRDQSSEDTAAPGSSGVPYYIGGAEADQTWSQFDRSDVRLQTYGNSVSKLSEKKSMKSINSVKVKRSDDCEMGLRDGYRRE